jgi:hypothetical protein
MFARSPSQALREALAHKIERWPGFVQRWRLSEAIEEHLIGVAMLQGKLEVALASLPERSSAAERREKFAAGLQTKSTENIFAVVVTLVKCGSGGTRGLGDAPHGQGSFAAARPQPAGGVKNALFELRVR